MDPFDWTEMLKGIGEGALILIVVCWYGVLLLALRGKRNKA